MRRRAQQASMFRAVRIRTGRGLRLRVQVWPDRLARLQLAERQGVA
jgi:hypothetical protein